METALVLTLDDAEPFDEIRREFDPVSFPLGVPFHVTLLYPFAPREELTDELLADVRAFFATQAPFEFALTHVAAWPKVVYAVPEPDDELRRVMRELFARFPRWPPYGGSIPREAVIPHATLGEDVDGAVVRDEIARRVAAHLPKRYVIDDASLLEEDESGRWRERERFALGGERA